MILETKRLYLREFTQSDLSDLSEILQNINVMYAYEHAFSNEEVQHWLDNQLRRYQNDGIGLWAVIRKENEQLIGQCGLTYQECDGEQLLEIGYLFKEAYWHQGYAIEAAHACKEYAFLELHAQQVFSIIRDTNIASQNVAKRNGMSVVKQIIKRYYGMDMPHDVYSVARMKTT